MGLDYEQSLFFLGPPEQNARDTQMTTRVTERLPPWFLASRGFAAQHSCGRALPLLNLKKKRYCSQSIMGFKLVTPARLDCKTVGFFLKISKEFGKAWRKSLTRAKRALSVFSLIPDILFDCSLVLEYAKIRTVLQFTAR